MKVRRTVHLPGLVVVIAAALAPSACTSDNSLSCADMRAELERFAPDAVQAWADIEELQENVELAMRLRAEFEDRCQP